MAAKNLQQFVRVCECGCGQPTKIAKQTARGRIKGQPCRVIYKHGRPRQEQCVGPRKVYSFGRRFIALYIARAEAALGHSLPPGAEVHHADGSHRDDAPLVICQDGAYHMLLHRRMRVKKAGGDPNTDWLCSRCKQTKPFSAFTKAKSKSNGLRHYCRECSRAYDRQRRPRQTADSGALISAL